MSVPFKSVKNTEEDSGPTNFPAPGKGVRFVTQRPLEVEADADVYNMSRNVRKAVIFNHFIFIHDGLLPRPGTGKDVNRLTTVLQLLNFSVTVYEDLTKTDLLRKLEEISKDNHDDCDCLAIFVLTHGMQHRLAAKDTYYYSEELWSHFASDSCPTMAGKPKLIVINSCRGRSQDYGTEFVGNLTTDGPPSSQWPDQIVYNVPNNADILIMFSTFYGFVSIRDEDAGSWFIQALCDILSDDRYNIMEIKQILTRITRKVALQMSSHRDKQVPVLVSSLIRDLYLR